MSTNVVHHIYISCMSHVSEEPLWTHSELYVFSSCARNKSTGIWFYWSALFVFSISPLGIYCICSLASSLAKNSKKTAIFCLFHLTRSNSYLEVGASQRTRGRKPLHFKISDVLGMFYDRIANYFKIYMNGGEIRAGSWESIFTISIGLSASLLWCSRARVPVCKYLIIGATCRFEAMLVLILLNREYIRVLVAK